MQSSAKPAGSTETPDPTGSGEHEPACPDAELARRASGDPELYALLYRRHFNAIAGYLYRRTGDASLAEDLAAETFLSAWKALAGYRDMGVPFRAWLLRIATNHANALARRERVHRKVLGLLARATGQSRRDEMTRDVREALARIPTDYQTVIAMVHFEQMSAAQIALVLDVPVATLRSRLRRARAALRVELQRQGDHQ